MVSHETAESELQNIVVFCQEGGRALQTLTDPCNVSGKANCPGDLLVRLEVPPSQHEDLLTVLLIVLAEEIK